ncbi:MAG: hypothetical protein IM638_04075 [Bacteroidetes bacterium]|nr:hypothetical protein [Bacteroidota bacterium]
MLGVILGCLDCPDKLRELAYAASMVAQAHADSLGNGDTSENENPGFQPLKT